LEKDKILNLLENLLAFYEEDPTDPFNIYALAIEYLKTEPEKSRTFFETLLTNYPEYIATYYQAAAFFVDRNEYEIAKKIYTGGIDMAHKLNKQHALNELKRAYQQLLDEEYD
jgi:tetratricopeptide (TPR) repeat protein